MIWHLCGPLYFIIFYVIDEVDHYYPSFDDFEKIKMAKSNCPGAKFKILSFHGWRTSSSIGRFINVSNF